MPILRRNTKSSKEKRRPEVVTGSFELHFEDVVNRNRYTLVALFASGLVLLAVFVPTAVYHSVATTNHVSVEAERGAITHPELVKILDADMTASGDSYVEFSVPVTDE